MDEQNRKHEITSLAYYKTAMRITFIPVKHILPGSWSDTTIFSHGEHKLSDGGIELSFANPNIQASAQVSTNQIKGNAAQNITSYSKL